MVRKFDIPVFYKGGIISRVKRSRQATDPRKLDLSPAVLDFGPVRIHLARHFGFCYGVENAIEIAYRILDGNAGRRVFFLSEMIHNPKVNHDLHDRGVRFIFTPTGDQLVKWTELSKDDIVVVPAFGTTLEMQEKLAERGINPYSYDTTCPFVEKVWKRSAQLGQQGFTVVVHGKSAHEETRATFSHSKRAAPTVIVRDLEEARTLSDIIAGRSGTDTFERVFRHKSSEGLDPERDLDRIGVVNQTTMLASETREIARSLREALVERFGPDQIGEHFADTSDTLCYATNENQNATIALIRRGADIAIVVGGYNSSNTSHIVELCASAMPTYFVSSPEEILGADRIRHFTLAERDLKVTRDWLPEKRPLDIVLTCGASCPDAILDEVLLRLISLVEGTRPVEDVLAAFPEPEPAP